jgi:hypothetical protein
LESKRTPHLCSLHQVHLLLRLWFLYRKGLYEQDEHGIKRDKQKSSEALKRIQDLETKLEQPVLQIALNHIKAAHPNMDTIDERKALTIIQIDESVTSSQLRSKSGMTAVGNSCKDLEEDDTAAP